MIEGINPLFTQEQAQALAQRLFTSIETGDAEAIRDVYAPDVTIRNNHTPQTTGVEDLIGMLSQMGRVVARMWFEPIRTQVTPNGFVDQHIAHFVTKKGASATLPSCMVVDVREGRITAVEEYANPADLAPVIAELMESASTTQ